jgi:hypothetical protein
LDSPVTSQVKEPDQPRACWSGRSSNVEPWPFRSLAEHALRARLGSGQLLFGFDVALRERDTQVEVVRGRPHQPGGRGPVRARHRRPAIAAEEADLVCERLRGLAVHHRAPVARGTDVGRGHVPLDEVRPGRGREELGAHRQLEVAAAQPNRLGAHVEVKVLELVAVVLRIDVDLDREPAPLQLEARPQAPQLAGIAPQRAGVLVAGVPVVEVAEVSLDVAGQTELEVAAGELEGPVGRGGPGPGQQQAKARGESHSS